MSGHDAYFHSNFLEHFNNVFVAGKHHHLMTLAGKLLPQASYGGTMQPLVPPWPGMAKKPDFVQKYEACRWRREGMSLFEFLRKSNNDGEIHRWLVQKHRDYVCTVVWRSQPEGAKKNARQVREEVAGSHNRRPKAQQKLRGICKFF